MLHTRNRLLKEIERWQAQGWITPEGTAGIKADVAARRSRLGLAQVLATLAAVLIGFAAMSFVAANWHDLSKLARLAVIFTGLWSSLAVAGVLLLADRGGFAHAALLAAVAIYGGGIMLIAQTYQMDGHPPDAVLLWGLGALAGGLLTRSNPVLAAALVVFVVWHWMELAETWNEVHWAFLPAWACVAGGFAMTRWRPGLHLVCLAIASWIIESGYLFGSEAVRGHLTVTLIGLGIVATSILIGPAIDRWRQVSGAMMLYGFAIAFAGAMALQFVVDRHGDHTLLYGAGVLFAIVAALAWSWRTDNKAALWTAYAAFSIEIFSLYVKKIGTLLGTSAFFLVAGLFVAALAFVAFRLHRATSDQPGEPA